MATLASIGLAVAMAQPWSFSGGIEEGQRWDVVQTVTLEQAGAASTLDANFTHRMTKVDPTGQHWVQSWRRVGFVRDGDQEVRDELPNERLIRYAPNGEIVAIEQGNAEPNAYRQAVLSLFIKPPRPVSVGESWSHKSLAREEIGLPERTVVFRFQAVVEDRAQIRFELQEAGVTNPQTATGTLLVEPDGRVHSSKVEVRNFLGLPDTRATITRERRPTDT